MTRRQHYGTARVSTRVQPCCGFQPHTLDGHVELVALGSWRYVDRMQACACMVSAASRIKASTLHLVFVAGFVTCARQW